jgi:hypothetical protein
VGTKGKGKPKNIVRSGIDETKPVVPPVKARERKKGPQTQAWAEVLNNERYIRVAVKRTGGFRANIHDDSIADAKERMAADKVWNKRGRGRPARGRTAEDGWDEQIHIPGYDNVDHASNQRSLKPRYPQD